MALEAYDGIGVSFLLSAQHFSCNIKFFGHWLSICYLCGFFIFTSLLSFVFHLAFLFYYFICSVLCTTHIPYGMSCKIRIFRTSFLHIRVVLSFRNLIIFLCFEFGSELFIKVNPNPDLAGDFFQIFYTGKSLVTKNLDPQYVEFFFQQLL